MTVRYSNEEQSPDRTTTPTQWRDAQTFGERRGPVQQVLFPQSYNANQFWELTVPVH